MTAFTDGVTEEVKNTVELNMEQRNTPTGL